ncbi:hypothetical protein [Gymnodinialimonas ulvae]|uniref:hypothetical protein n=1 Tax=Gymnodinialimonas ulvae TaxID=3126504 RepID=UPI0030ED477F
MIKLSFAAFAALALSGCVVLDEAPAGAVGPGPFLTGGGAAAPAPAAAPDLGSRLAGRTLVGGPEMQGATWTLRNDGFSVTTAPNGQQLGGGQWYTEGRQLCHESFGGGFDCAIAEISGSTLRLTYGDGRSAVFTIT